MFLLDNHDNRVNAEFSLDLSDREHCVVVESAGGATGGQPPRNQEYNKLLSIVLARLAHANARITRVVLDSAKVAHLPVVDRTAKLSVPYPIDLAAQDIEEFRKMLQRTVASMHREPTASSTSGNSQKRIRICLDVPISPDHLLATPGKAFEIDELPDGPPDLSDTERKSLRAARLGQGKFRDDLMARYKGVCPVLGVRHPLLLVASHIKPWRVCTNAERLDPDNGILLSTMLDRLFDKGLISFTDNGEIVPSPLLHEADRDICRLARGKPVDLPAGSKKYLNYHREIEFKTS